MELYAFGKKGIAMGKYDGNYFEEMSKQRQKREENERREKHAQYISRRIPEDVINALGKRKAQKRADR